MTLNDFGPLSPLVIAEGGQNHNGDIIKAFELVDAVGGVASAYKSQIHLPDDEMVQTLMPEVYERISRDCLTIDEEFQLMEYVKSKGLFYICTCYCDQAYTYVPDLAPDALKIGSGEANNDYLLNIAMAMAQEANIPVFRSHGLGFPTCGYENVVDMVCESVYPPSANHFRLNLLRFLASTPNVWGYSCHFRDTIPPAIAWSLGASAIEFHVGFAGCHDQKVSWTPKQLSDFMRYMNALVKEGEYYDESVKQWATQGYVAAQPILRNDKLVGKIATKRPCGGAIPATVPIIEVWERRAVRDIEPGDQITQDNTRESLGQTQRTTSASVGIGDEAKDRSPSDVDPSQETKTIH